MEEGTPNNPRVQTIVVVGVSSDARADIAEKCHCIEGIFPNTALKNSVHAFDFYYERCLGFETPEGEMRILKANEPHLRLFRRYDVIVILGVIGVSVIFGFVPWLRKPIVREHNVLEMITAICFVLSAALSIYRLQGVTVHSQRIVLAVIPIFAIFGFLEEISYGLILAGARPPQILDVNIDALHDFFLVLYIVLRDYVPEWITGIMVVIMFILVGYGVRLGRLFDSRTYVVMLRQFPALGFVGICGVFLIVAAVFDLEIVVSQWLVLAENY